MKIEGGQVEKMGFREVGIVMRVNLVTAYVYDIVQKGHEE